MKIKDLVLRLHRWGGLATGLVVVVLCLTGAVLLITLPIDSSLNARLGRDAPVDAPLVSPSVLLETATAEHPDAPLRSLEIRFADTRRADVQFRDNRTVLVDPWDASFVGSFSEDGSISGWWTRLHTDLLLGERGRQVVGAATILFLVLTTLGLWLWWPSRRTVGRAFVPTLRRGLKRANYDLHNVLGFYTSLLLLVLGLTGVFLSYRGLQQTAFSIAARVFAASETSTGPLPAAPPESAGAAASEDDAVPAPDDLPPVDRAWAAARELFPDAPWQRISFGAGQAFRVQVGAGEPGDMVRRHVVRIDADGNVSNVTRAEDASLVDRLPGMVSRLHTGEYGIVYRAAAFVACVVGASLPITGFIIWFPRWRRRRSKADGGD